MQLLHRVMLFKNSSPLNAALASGHAFQKFQPFECTSIAPGHAFQNSSPLNVPPLCRVMLSKMPAI
jgi:hypothetical protein